MPERNVTSEPVPAATVKASRHRVRRPPGEIARESLQGLIFAGPALLVLGLFLVYPAVQTMRLAFYRGFGFRFEGYLGLDNFKELLHDDPDFLDLSQFPPTGALVNNLKWIVIYITVCLIFG